MSDNTPGPDGQPNVTPPPTPPPAAPPATSAPAQTVYVERVGIGLSWAFLAVLGGIILTVLIWRAGFIASISSFAMAAGALFLYVKMSGSVPRKGLVPLIVLLVLGLVASFFAIIASDAWDAYDVIHPAQSRSGFIMDNIFQGDVIRHYGKDGALFALFAVLGVFSTLRRLIATPR